MATVSFDARELRNASAPAAGISRYIRGLIPALAREEPRLQIVAHSSSPGDAPAEWSEIPNLEVRPLPPSRWRRVPFVWPHMVVPRELGRGGVSLIHGPSNSLPLGRLDAPAVVSIHDLAIYEHPEWYPDGQWLSLRRVVPAAVARSTLILCGSQRTAREVGRLFPGAAGKTRVVPYGLEPQLAEPAGAAGMDELRQRLGLPPRYILAIGTVEPRKGYDVLIQAFARLAPEVPDTGLLIVGGRGWKCETTLALPETLGVADRARFLGYVPEADLRLLLSGATIFAAPSFDEGFGFPALEAMAAGVAVVASQAGAIPEVTGDAAMLVRSGDAEALRGALRRLLDDDVERGRLAQLGRQRSRQFTWEECARGTLRIYREAGLRL